MTTVRPSGHRPRQESRAEETAWFRVPSEGRTAITVSSTVEGGIPGHHPYVGRVDANTPDSSIAWVISGSGSGLPIFGHREGVRLQSEAGTS